MLARKRVIGAVVTAAISLVLMVGSAAAIPAAQASVAGPAHGSATAAASTNCSSTIPFSYTPSGTAVTISLYAYWACDNTTVLTNSQAYIYNGAGGLQGSGNICSGTLPSCLSMATVQVPANSTVWVLYSFTLYNPSIDLNITETASQGGCLGNGTHLVTCALMSLQTQV